MFAADVGLLPDHMFTRMLRHAQTAPAQFSELAGELFRVMAFGGRVGFEAVAWFNGGLFDNADALPLERSDIEMVLAASGPRSTRRSSGRCSSAASSAARGGGGPRLPARVPGGRSGQRQGHRDQPLRG